MRATTLDHFQQFLFAIDEVSAYNALLALCEFELFLAEVDLETLQFIAYLPRQYTDARDLDEVTFEARNGLFDESRAKLLLHQRGKYRVCLGYCFFGFVDEDLQLCLVTSNLLYRGGLCLYRHFAEYSLNGLRGIAQSLCLLSLLRGLGRGDLSLIVRQRFIRFGFEGDDLHWIRVQILGTQLDILTAMQDAVLFVGCIYNPLEVVVGNDREFVDMLHARSLALERQTQASADSLLDEGMRISRTERNDGVKIANIPALTKHVDMYDNLDGIALLLDGKEELCEVVLPFGGAIYL